MIESLRAVNFRAHRSITVRLGRWTVLYGANGAGKSSILDAMNIVSSVLEGASVRTMFPGVYALDRQMHDASLASIQFEVVHRIDYPLGHPSDRVVYRLELGLERGRPFISTEELEVNGLVSPLGGGPGTHTSAVPGCSTIDSDLLDTVRSSHLHARRYRLFPDSVRRRADSAMHFIKRDGEGMPPAFAHETRLNPASISDVVAAVRSADPGILDVRSVPGGSGESEFEFDTPVRTGLSGAYLSDGQALALAVSWLATSPRAPRLVMIDEPETSLSPVALATLLDRIDELMPAERQVLLTTHSPYVIKWAINNAQPVQQVRPDFGARTWQEALRAQGVDPSTVYDGANHIASTVNCCALLETWLTG